MEEGEDARIDLMPRIRSSAAGVTSSTPPKLPARPDLAGRGQFRAAAAGLPPSHSPESAKRPGIPPAHPHGILPSRFPSPHTFNPSSSSGGGAASHHSRSLSQPAFFSLDSLPPFTIASPHFPDPLPSPTASPRKAHRRSQSDIPFGFTQPLSASPPPIPPRSPGFLPRPNVKQELNATTDPGIDDNDLFSAYMNLDSLDTLNSSEDQDRREDLDSRASGSKTNCGGDSSENEAESSSVNESGSSGQRLKEGNKRSAPGDLLPITSRHCRSLSMDSFMGKLNFGEESPSPMLPPSPAARPAQHSRSGSMDGAPSMFSLEFGNGEFNPTEIKKIMANEKLAEIAVADPKRAKRILANRQSAARSKERKMQYISELEHKVQTLQTEATTLSAQLTMLQRDSSGLTSQNNELRFRLQAMEQDAQLRAALNETLTAEVQRLKLVTSEMGEAHLSNSLSQQIQLNSQVYQLQQRRKQQQSTQMPLYQLQQQNSSASKHDEN